MCFLKKIFPFLFFGVILLNTENVPAFAENLPEITAKGCVLTDAATGQIIYGKNENEKLPMASTTKIMTVLLCLESGELDKEFVVDSVAIKTEGSSMGLREGDIVTKRFLCYGMLLPSGNDAANAAAVACGGSIENFALMMNEKAAELGLEKTFFVTPSGLEGIGHGSSAYDMAVLASAALKNKDFAEMCSCEKKTLKFGNPPYERTLYNTNKLLAMYDGVNGVKTGFTDEAGRCLVSSCEKNGVTLICVTLNDKNDWNEHMSLYDYGFSAIQKDKLTAEKVTVCDAESGKNFDISPENSITYGKLENSNAKTDTIYETRPFIYRSDENNSNGKVNFFFNGKKIGESELVSK